MKSSRMESIFVAEMPLIKSVGAANDTPVAVIPRKFVALYHINTDYCYTSFIVDYSSASCVSAIVQPRDFVVMILVLFCYRGLKIMELKSSFVVTFSRECPLHKPRWVIRLKTSTIFILFLVFGTFYDINARSFYNIQVCTGYTSVPVHNCILTVNCYTTFCIDFYVTTTSI